MAKKKNRYPSPDKDPEFTKYWDSYIESVTGRENFKEGHLFQLEILCNLHKEHKKLTDVLEITGQTYINNSQRYGDVIKTYPEVTQLNHVRGQIVLYTKMLGLMLVKDTKPSTSQESEEWD